MIAALKTLSPILRKAGYRFIPPHISGCQLWLDASRFQIGAAQFNVANLEYLTTPNTSYVQTGDVNWSISVWTMTDQVGTSRVIVSKGDEEFNLWLLDTGIFSFEHGSAGSVNATNHGVAQVGVWYHIVIVHDADANTLTISVNGVSNTASTVGAGPTFTRPFTVGARGDAAWYWAGRICKVGFWKNRALTSDEIVTLRNGGAGLYYAQLSAALRTSLVEYWDLNEASGARASGGRLGTAARFTSASVEYLSRAHTPDLSPTAAVGFTVAHRIRLASKTATMYTFDSESNGGVDASQFVLNYWADADPGNDRLRFDISGTEAPNFPGTRVIADTYGSPPTGTWIFVVAWWDPDTDTVNIQVNDGPVDTVARTSGGLPGLQPLAIFNIGADTWGGAHHSWDGDIQKAGVWQRVLSAAERTQLYNGGAGFWYSELPAGLLTGLKGYWNLDEASGQRNDSSGNAYHLTDINTVTRVTQALTDNNTVSAAPSMTPETPADATLVYEWADLSGNGNHATQATEGAKPLYKVGIVNGRPVVRFDGLNDYLVTAANNIGRNSAGLTLITVLQTTAPGTAAFTLCIATNVNTDLRAGLRHEYSGAGKFGIAGRRLDADSIASIEAGSFVSGAWGIDVALVDYANARVSFYRNGTAIFENSVFQTAGNTSDTDSAGTFVGAQLPGTTGWINGDIKHVLIYNRVLSASEQRRLERWASRDCGIAVS